jgi:2-keto-4-pentenoate hydratase/2-oxohepta-3-ene-1,7-dioic acid hydratase in catechol pathway
MTIWLRCEHEGRTSFGRLEGETVHLHGGKALPDPEPTGETVSLPAVRLLTPCRPGKLLGLWNNFHERARVEHLPVPEHPLYFVKTDNCYLAHQGTIRCPTAYEGPVVFEGELGIVIGKTCSAVAPAQAADHIFGYTCVNDVTARVILKSDPTFPQWVRAKSFDTFGPFGPWIATDLEPDELWVRTLVNGVERQNYPVADMFFRPREIVSRLSHDMTLNPGDLICCGTSVGVEAMPRGCRVDVDIAGIGVLSNRYA